MLAGGVCAAAGDPERHERLSHLEYHVFQSIPGGRTGSGVGEIAEQLSLAPSTVSTYRARILEKTGARNDVELALYTLRVDLLPT